MGRPRQAMDMNGAKIRRALRVLLVLAVLLLSSRVLARADNRQPSADQSSSEVASAWFERLYDIVKEEGTTPPPASRIYGVAAVALYESIVSGTRHHRSLAGQLNGLTSMPEPEENRRYSWPTVANVALAQTIRGLYPALSQPSITAINDLELHFATRQKAIVPRRQYERSVAHGEMIANAILEGRDRRVSNVQRLLLCRPPRGRCMEANATAVQFQSLATMLGPDTAHDLELGRGMSSAGPPGLLHRTRVALLRGERRRLQNGPGVAW